MLQRSNKVLHDYATDIGDRHALKDIVDTTAIELANQECCQQGLHCLDALAGGALGGREKLDRPAAPLPKQCLTHDNQTTTTMNSNSNDWKTVPSAAPRFGRAAPAAAPMRPAFGGPRDAPSAFRQGEPAPSPFGRAQPNERAAARQAESARIAEEQRRKQEAEAVAARKEAEALNFASSAAYPALGGGGAPKKATTMNYKRTVEEMVERQKELEAAAAVAEATNWWDVPEPTRKAPPRYIRQRNMEELDDDHLSVEEDEEQEDEGEFNANIVPGRRRGDKGVW